MSSILQFLRNFLGSSSPETDVSKKIEDYVLLNDAHVNQLNFPTNSKTYQFSINDLQFKEDICTNDKAAVEHYVFRPLKFSLVAKTLRIPIIQRQLNEERLKVLIEEAKILRQISHGANITDFYGYALYDKKVWIFMELMEVSLEELYRYFHEKLYPELRFSKEIVIPENVIGVIAVRILDALAFCKKQGVMHRDVKPKNVLVNKKGEVKLCDFGDSKILALGSKTKTFKGTLPYIPPERFKYDQPYDDRTDIWSLGITLVEIVYGDIPYDIKGLHLDYDFNQIVDVIKNADDNKIMSQCFSEKYSEELQSFTKSCLNELNLRPRYPELMETILYKSFVAKNDNNNTMKIFIKIYKESLNIENNSLNAKDYYYSRGIAQQELKSDYADAYNNRGIAQRKLGKYNEAIADYIRAIELDPTNAIAYNNRGIAYDNLGKYNEAIADYTKAIELDPTNAIAYSNRGNTHNSFGKYNEAIADCTKAIELDPTNAIAYGNRGIAHNSLGKYNEAIGDYTRAIELDPTNAIAYNNRGNTHNNLGKHNEAIADCTKAIELDPTFAIAYYNRGNAHNSLGKYNEAIADCTKAIELDPTNAIAYNNRGNAHKNLGKYNEAIADCTKAIELNPTFAIAYYNRGNAQNSLGKYNEAIEDFSLSTKLDPTLAPSYYGRGNAQLEQGRFSESIIDYTEFMKLNPYDRRRVSNSQLDQRNNKVTPMYTFSIEWNSLYALAYNNSGVSIEESRKCNIDFPQDFEWNPSNVFADNNRGTAHIKLGQYDKAVADFTEAIELKPSCALLYNNRGTVQAELGKYNEAIADYTKAIELNPGLNLAVKNQKVLMDKINSDK